MHKNAQARNLCRIWSKQTVLCIASIVSGSSRPPLGGRLPKSICRPTTAVAWWPKTAVVLKDVNEAVENVAQTKCKDTAKMYSDSSTLFVRSDASEGQQCQNPFILVRHLTCPSCCSLAAIPVKVVSIFVLCCR